MSEEILKLKKELERLRKSVKKQRYGLVWMDVPESFEDDVENKLPILKEVPELAIKNDDGKPTHILIEGDNYHALTCLNYTHKGKIDVIYIDPPYNTGSDGFKYKDKRIIDKFPDGTEVPKDHPFRHSYWLSFMKKRLELARDLLKEDGVIYVSIDDEEIHNLALLMEEIFSPKNFIGILKWKRKKQPSYLHGHIAGVMEYIVVCAKNSDKLEKLSIAERTDSNTRIDNAANDVSTRILKKGVRVKLPKEVILIKKGKYVNKTMTTEYLSDVHVKNGRTLDDVEIKAQFRNHQSWIDRFVEEDVIFITKNYGLRRDLLKDEKVKRKAITDLLLDWGDNQDSDVEIKKIFGGNKKFDYPKPTKLIKNLIKAKQNKDLIILDFFAGSGTTAHAVMELNGEDDGSRSFILVTNNENNIMKEVCYPRIKKIIKGYPFEGESEEVLMEKEITFSELKRAEKIIQEIDKIKEKNKKSNIWNLIEINFEGGVLRVVGKNIIKGKTEGLGNSLKYYRTSFIGKNNILNATDSDKVELAHNVGELLAIAENTLELVKQNKYYQLFENQNKDRYTAVYFREELDKFEEFVEMVEKLKKKTTVYVFSWGNEEFSDNFEHIKDIRIKTIPQPILEIYKSIYNLGVYDV